MYNEEPKELRTALTGLLHNYNCLKLDEKHKFSKDDFLVCLIVDGYDGMKDVFKQLAREKRFLDEEVLLQKGFMELNKEGNPRMKQMKDLMDPDVKPEKVPNNLLHVFQVTTWDFGIDAEVL